MLNGHHVHLESKVGDLLLLPNTEYATTEQVAEYYNVGVLVIRQIVSRNRDELSMDGLTHKTGKEIKSIYDTCDILSRVSNVVNINNVQGGMLVNDIKVGYSKNTLFPKRAILRVGMILPIIEGGFGEDKKSILVKDIAEIHKKELSYIKYNLSYLI